jgi:hypothetical protein
LTSDGGRQAATADHAACRFRRLTIPGIVFTGSGASMTVSEKIYAYLRSAKMRDRGARISDFQMRVGADNVTLVNLKTRAEQVFPLGDCDKERF